MKTLLVCREAPFPPTTGAPLRLWQQVNLLRSLGPVSVFSIGPAVENRETPLISEWVHIDDEKVRTRNVPKFLRLFNVLKPTAFPGVGDFADRKLNKQLREFIRQEKPDLVILSHWPSAMPSALRSVNKIIVDSHNIESKLWADQMPTGSIGKRIRYFLFSRRESRLSEDASATWVTSDIDKSFLLSMSKKPLSVTVWPNAIDLSYYESDRLAATTASIDFERSFPTLIFVGYMAYSPNHDAARMLILDILPQVRERYPNVRAFIVGKDPRADLIKLAAGVPNVFVTGTVSDVRPYIALSDIVVVPLTVGGGTRIKLLEAFASRVAVVSTSKGAQGIAAAGSAEVAIADTAEEMAKEILVLLDDPIRRNLQIDRAYKLVESQFSWQSLIRRLPHEIKAVVDAN
jgi:glycosyltransferase involved in cell wall biosynthesis